MDDKGRKRNGSKTPRPAEGPAVDPPDDEAAELAAAELARDRRRDHDTTARERAGMNTGLAKQFKQVLDTQRRRADEVEGRAPHTRKR